MTARWGRGGVARIGEGPGQVVDVSGIISEWPQRQDESRWRDEEGEGGGRGGEAEVDARLTLTIQGHSSEEELAGYQGGPGARQGKKTKGRVKIKMEFIDNKLRRYTTFSKRKTGIMKKAYELSTLTGTQVWRW